MEIITSHINLDFVGFESMAAVDKFDSVDVKIIEILLSAGSICDGLGFSAFAVGGFVRDILLNIDNTDIDIVVVGDAIKAAKMLCEKYNGELKIHKRFKTSTVIIEGKFKIDIVTARREYYEYPAALPIVEEGSLKSDLYRRDFTINSMAMSINPNSFGKLIDYFGGQKDLQEGIIRVLYNMSFIEDPTRIFRAVRFEQRYNFSIEEQTYEYLNKAVDSNVLLELSNERITNEILLSLKENNACRIIGRIYKLGIFNKLFSWANINDESINKIKNIEQKEEIKNLDKVIIFLLLLFENTEDEYQDKMFEKLKLNKVYKEKIKYYLTNRNMIIDVLSSKSVNDYDIYCLLNKSPYEVRFIIKNASDKRTAQRIDKYEKDMMDLKVCVNGSTLKRMGLKSGPKYKEILSKVFEARINKELNSYEEEIEYVKKLLYKGCN